MSGVSKRMPFPLSKKHAEYLIELIEDDLELDDEKDTLTSAEREMAEALLHRLKDVGPDIDRWHKRRREELAS
jgi:hypothetical protein